MGSSFAKFFAIFCIKVCFFVALATQFLGEVVEKYNAELRKNLGEVTVVDPSWNPNDLLVKGWAPVLNSYPEVQRKVLSRQILAEPSASDIDGNSSWELPIKEAPIELPIRSAGQN